MNVWKQVLAESISAHPSPQLYNHHTVMWACVLYVHTHAHTHTHLALLLVLLSMKMIRSGYLYCVPVWMHFFPFISLRRFFLCFFEFYLWVYLFSFWVATGCGCCYPATVDAFEANKQHLSVHKLLLIHIFFFVFLLLNWRTWIAKCDLHWFSMLLVEK